MAYAPRAKKPFVKPSELQVPEAQTVIGGVGSGGVPAPVSVTSAQNLGSGSQVFSTLNLGQLQFRSIINGPGITVTQTAGEIEVRVKVLTAMAAFTTSSAGVNGLSFSNPPTQAELETFRDEVKDQLNNIIADLNAIKTYVTQLET